LRTVASVGLHWMSSTLAVCSLHMPCSGQALVGLQELGNTRTAAQRHETLRRVWHRPVGRRHSEASVARLPHMDGLGAVAAGQPPRRHPRPVERIALVLVLVAAAGDMSVG
jgi:hypothetical protein